MEKNISAKLDELLKDESFILEMIEKETKEEVKALLAEKGVELPLEAVEALMKEVSKSVDEVMEAEALSDDDLEEVAGGKGNFNDFKKKVAAAIYNAREHIMKGVQAVIKWAELNK